MASPTTTQRERLNALIDQINTLAAERSALYRRSADGWTPAERARLKEVDQELAVLWEQRRRAQAGRDDVDDVPVRHVA